MEIDKWRDDKGFWSTLLKKKKNICLKQIRKVHLRSCNTWSHVDRLRLVYLCVIAGMVMAKDEKVWIPHKYIKLVMDFNKLRKYPWGLHSFDALVTSIITARDKVKTQNSYVIDGFSYALQIWLMEAIPDIGSLLSKKLREGVTSMRCRNWKGSAKVSYEDIISLESDFGSTGQVFPYISSTGNCDVIVDASFERAVEMKDERVDLIIDMYRKKHDWSKHVWGYQETVQPYVYSSEEDGSEEEEAGETSENEMEEESIHVSPTKKRKNKFQDIGAESRKKRLLCQRSTDKYRDLEAEMKSYIHGLLKSSFASLALEVREIIDARFAKFEEMVLSSQTPCPSRAPAPSNTPGAAPACTDADAPAPSPPDDVPAPSPSRSRAPASSRSRAPASSRSRAPASSRSRASAPSPVVGKTRSQTKQDADLSDVFGSLFGTLDVNLGTQEHLQKTMGNLTQESYVNGFDPSQGKKTEAPENFTTPMTSFRPSILKRPSLTDIDEPEGRCKDSDYTLVFVPEDKWSKLVEWSLNPNRLQIGPSTFDGELCSRIIGPNHWFKNYDIDAMMYLFQEKTSLCRWKVERVAFLSCLFSNQIISSNGKFQGNKRGYQVDDILLDYGRGELPYHGRTGSVWDVDVDRLYIPVFVNQNHWISMCVNLVNRTVEVFDCGGRKNTRTVEAFASLIPRIVKAVQPSDKKKDLNVKQYSISYVPMPSLNKTGNDCGAYALKFIECHVLGLDFALLNDENIQEARHKIAYDLWEAANDEVLQYRMSMFKAPKRAPEEVVELSL
ncbi:hypothetical protein N665_0162s0054 [Sinapis alba]|nr:hypothetical protein N665_0162s0054 [Sinapis alba]